MYTDDVVLLTTVIHAEQEDSGPVMMMVLVGIVQFLVPVVRGTPNPMLDRRSEKSEQLALYRITTNRLEGWNSQASCDF